MFDTTRTSINKISHPAEFQVAEEAAGPGAIIIDVVLEENDLRTVVAVTFNADMASDEEITKRVLFDI